MFLPTHAWQEWSARFGRIFVLAFTPAPPSTNAITMPAKMAGHRCCASMAFLPDFMNTIARRRTGIIKRLAVLLPAGLTSDAGKPRRVRKGFLTTEAVARELIETKAYGLSAKAHGIDAGAHALVCALARSPARFLVRSLGLVRTKPACVGANRSTGGRGFGGLCRRGSHGEARGRGEEGRLRRRLQL